MTKPSQVKERPILFSAPMVRALLEGRKTQTRRVIKLPHTNPLGEWEPTTVGGGGIYDTKGRKVPHQGAIWHTRTGDVLGCPYGQPGDRLWVRETVWLPRSVTPRDLREGADTWPKCIYSADTDATEIEWMREMRWKQRPAIHCPRWASRILLEVTDVRVQRVQDISEADIDAEVFGGNFPHRVLPELFPDANESGALSMRECFARLWDSINAKRGFGWDANPWVWAITFRCIDDNAQ